MKVLRRTQFGNPILRDVSKRLTKKEITSEETQNLIRDMFHTLKIKEYGVGLAAPQVGKSLAISVIGIKPTPSRPKLPKQQMVVINPKIIETYGRRSQMWEGCISFGVGNNFPYAKALRYKKVRVRYQDETGKSHEKSFDGIEAHVLQHEIDHLNGVLFVDRVKDTTTYMTISEYKKLF